MKRVAGTTNLAIGAQNDNALSGKTFQFAPDTGAARFYALTSAGDVRCTILVGADLVVDDAQLQIGSSLKVPDDMIAEHGAYRGEQIVVRLRQVAGAAAVDVKWAVDFEPIN